MQKSNQRLDTFISEITSGEDEASPMSPGEEMGGDRVWSGDVAEIDEATFSFFKTEHSGAPKVAQDDWFIFSDSRTVTEPGIIFWQNGERFFARKLDQTEWDKFLKAAKVTKKYW